MKTKWNILLFTATLACTVVILSTTLAMAAPPHPKVEERPKIGLALSGGGARGAAHIGVLRVLEKYRIPIDYIAGTSMGSIVGGLYATGMSVDELEETVTRIDWADAFVENIPRVDRTFRRKRDDDFYLVKNKPGLTGMKLRFPRGLLDGQKIDLLLKRYTMPVMMIRDFDDFAIPYRAVSADLVTGETVVTSQGDLARAMRTSMSLPVIFAPKEIDDMLLIDGGVSCNLPIDVVRQMGADIVIAVDISTPLQSIEELSSVMAVTDQLTGILTRRNTDIQIASLNIDDIFIKPELGDITTGSFERAGEAIPTGVTAAEAVSDKLTLLSMSEDDYENHLAGREQTWSVPVIDGIKLVNRSRISDRVLISMINVEKGQPLDIDMLERDLARIYGLELFESVYYDITRKHGACLLTITAQEASWGPNYIQFGAAVYEDYESPNFNLAAAYTRTAINSRNGEWRFGVQIGQEPGIFAELYQPLDFKLRNFIQLRASFGEWAINAFDANSNLLAEWGMKRYGIEVSSGRELGAWGEIRVGVIRDMGKMEIQAGDPAVPDYKFDSSRLFLQFFADEMDDLKFPLSGRTLRVRLSADFEALGSDQEFEQGTIEGTFAKSIGQNTGLLGGQLAVTNHGNAPIQNRFNLGGFTRLSGLERNELTGQNAGLIYGAFYRKIGTIFILPVFAGLSLEYGNVFQDRKDIDLANGIVAGSIFLGLDSYIGPIYIGWGFAEAGRNNFYLILGQPMIHRRAGFLNR
ncbi:MAG: patatin-like phospholipase family protein [Bacteroidales bacterium]|nr:patatin-like phospholipase family protein [Candidatus Latescibacterota bacterium]